MTYRQHFKWKMLHKKVCLLKRLIRKRVPEK